MRNRPLLGGLDIKYAGAYLLPPTPLKKKKKKMSTETEDTDVEKMASAIGDAIVNARLSLIKQQLRSGDLGGGWHPDNQINSIK
jgi:hypothetical protein